MVVRFVRVIRVPVCARVSPVSPGPRSFSYFGGSVHTPATFGVESVGDESRS